MSMLTMISSISVMRYIQYLCCTKRVKMNNSKRVFLPSKLRVGTKRNLGEQNSLWQSLDEFDNILNKDLDTYLRIFHEHVLYCYDPVSKATLVDVFLHGMLEGHLCIWRTSIHLLCSGN